MSKNNDYIRVIVNNIADKHLKSNALAEEFANLMIGDLIGKGGSREVFECKFDKKLVIKIETTETSCTNALAGNNFLEYKIWKMTMNLPKIRAFLAPCVSLSSGGKVLIQEKTQSISRSQMPKMIPDFLDDLKEQNWGELNGKIVCHDYGSNSAMWFGIHNSKMVESGIFPRKKGVGK